MNSSTFCILPYAAMNVHIDGGLSPCCYQSHDDVTHKFSEYKTWRSAGVHDLKKNLINGQKDQRCQRCWDLESSGVRSYRQQWNENLSHIIGDHTQWSPEMILPLQMLHLDFDNFCNLRCIMCHPQVSSSIESEYRLHQTLYEPFIGKPPLLDSPWHTDSQFEQLIHSLDTVDTLIVTGGEPLINPKVIKLIQSLHPQKLNLIVTTNGTQIKPDVYKLLQNLRSCSITVSLEGVGAHNEYLRYGSHWIEQEKNIKWLSQLPNARWIPMLINHTLQMTSCWSLPALIDWCVENNYDFSINRLTWPTYLSLECMTDFQRKKLINDLAQRIMSVRQTFGDGNTLSWLKGTIECLENVKHDAQRADQFRRYVNMLDTIRGTSFDDVFPSFGHQPPDGY